MTSRLRRSFPAAGWIVLGLLYVGWTGFGAEAGPGGAGTTEIVRLAFTNLYKSPIGPRGLEYTDTIRSAAGRKVRFEGYMVRQASPIPYSILLSPLPLTLHEKEYGLAEDLPASAVHVFLRKSPTPFLRPIRGLVAVEGMLEIGPREEGDGRISHARLTDAQLVVGTNVFPAVLEVTGRRTPQSAAPVSEVPGNSNVPSKATTP